MKYNKLVVKGDMRVKKIRPPGTGAFLAGTYSVFLPTIGVVAGSDPAFTDNNGDATINALIAATPGDIINVPDDTTYVIDAPIVVPAGKRLQALDGETVVFKRAAGYTGNMVVITATTAGAAVSNITFNGNFEQNGSSEGVSDAYAVKLSGGGNHIIEHCTFINHPSVAVYSENVSNLTVQYNSFSECYQSMYFDGNDLGNFGTITGNQSVNTSARRSVNGMTIVNSVRAQVFHNRFIGAGTLAPTNPPTTYGVSIFIQDSDQFRIENNTCEQSRWSSFVAQTGSTNGLVQHNSFIRGVNDVRAAWVVGAGSGGVGFNLNMVDGGVVIDANACSVIENIVNALNVDGVYIDDDAVVSLTQGNLISRVPNSTVTNMNGIVLWGKNSTAVNCRVLSNNIQGFSNAAIAINNVGGNGSVFNITATGNVFTGNNANYSIPAGISVNVSCVLEGYSTAPPAPPPPPPPPPAPQETAHGSTIPPFTSFLDGVGATWTVVGGVIFRNGVQTISSNVTLLLYYNHTVYQQNSVGGWWLWNNTNSSWVASSDPRVTVETPPAPSADALNVLSFGANGNGSFDNTTALRNAFSAGAAQGKTVFIPAGNFNHSGVLTISSCAVLGTGDSSVLYGTDVNNTSIFMKGQAPSIKWCKIHGVVSGSRLAPWEATRIAVFAASAFAVDHCTILNAPAASLQLAQAAGPGSITNNTFRDSLSDTIHMTDRAHDITVTGNKIYNGGDDGIACVSYQADGGRCVRITARNNEVYNNLFGRNMSIVGGQDILYDNNLCDTNLQYAGVYVSQEASFNTFTVLSATIKNTTIRNCGSNTTGHNAIMFFTESGSAQNTNVVFQDNDIYCNGTGGIRWFGHFGSCFITNNRITGANANYTPSNLSVSGTTVSLFSAGPVGYSAVAVSSPSVPVPVPSIPSVSRHPHDFLQMGNAATGTYWVEDNRWGSAGITEGTGSAQFAEAVERWTSVGTNGEVAFRTTWRWPTPAPNTNVKAYPAMIYGAKPGYSSNGSQWPAFDFAVRLPDGLQVPPPANTPSNIATGWISAGGSVSTLSPTGDTPGSNLPSQMPFSQDELVMTGRWTASVTGVGHIAFDCWVQQPTAGDVQAFGFKNAPVTHEIMVSLFNWGNYGAYNHNTNGANFGWYSHDVVIEGVTWHVFVSKDLTRNATTGATGQGVQPGLQYNFPSFGSAGLNPTFTNEETGSGRIGWKFIRFVADGTTVPLQSNGQFRVNLGAMMNHLTTQNDSRGIAYMRGTEWLVDVELGIEMIEGQGDVTIYDYKVTKTPG